MQNKANLKLRYLLSIKQHSEMNIFCLKQGEVLKPSGPSVACEQQTYFRSEDGKYVCGSQASRSAAHL